MDRLIETLFHEAKMEQLSPGSYLFHAGDSVRFVHLIQGGTVSLERVQQSGQTTCFQRAHAGSVLAEASVYARHYHCDARALDHVSLRRLRLERFRSGLERDPTTAHAWAAHLAHTVQRTRLNAEIRGLKTVAEKLDAWLGEYGELPAKGQWQSVAQELAVSREALYRELSKRKWSAH